MTRKLRPLTQGEAKTSLAARLGRIHDRTRQVNVRLGFRPYRVFLVWTKWNGAERGEGVQEVMRRCELLPTPLVQDLSSVALSPYGAGVLPVGSVRIREVSPRYSLELLMGRVYPEEGEDQVPQPYDFFYEVVADGRHLKAGEKEPRARFRVMATPFFDAENQEWSLVLERQSGEMDKEGQPVAEAVDPPVDPWSARELPRPEDD